MYAFSAPIKKVVKVKIFIFKRRTLKIALSLALAVIITLSILIGSKTINVFSKNERKLPIYSVQKNEKVISISFDAAWGSDKTKGILDLLKKYDVKATFFLVEFWTEKNKDIVKEIYESGHAIGTHSKTHSNMSKLSKEQIESELKSSSKVIEDITGNKVTLFRAPYGDYDDLLIDCAKDLGLYTIQWDVDSLDWKGLTGKEISSRILNRVKNGSIILCHNNSEHILDALPLILPTLKENGYKFVRIDDLIYKENYKMAHDGTQVPLEEQ